MTHIKFLLISMIIFLLIGCNSTGVVRKDKGTQFMSERIAIKHYLEGDYASAFEALSQNALWGYKESQYFLAFMFLKGQHVQQSTVLGMAWLGVAKETGRKDWEAQYDQFYAAAPPDLKTKIDKKLAEYVSKFGLKAQNMTCSKTPSLDSARPRVRCHKSERLSPMHELELVE